MGIKINSNASLLWASHVDLGHGDSYREERALEDLGQDQHCQFHLGLGDRTCILFAVHPQCLALSRCSISICLLIDRKNCALQSYCREEPFLAQNAEIT